MPMTDLRPCRPLHGLAFGVLLALAGCQSTPPAHPAGDRHVAQAITQLQARADADSLAAAALLRRLSDGDAALVLAEQALEADPNRPDLLWLTIRLCADRTGCSPVKWERRLLDVDRKNGAPYLENLILASAAGDEPASQSVLDGVAQSERLELYWVRLLVRGTRAVVQTGTMPLAAAETSILGALSVLVPPFQALTRHCEDSTLADPLNRDRCQRLAAVLQRGDTVVAEMIGVEIAQRAWPEGSEGRLAADKARRVHDHRVAALAKDPQWMQHHPEQFLALAEANGREQELVRQQIVLMGLPPDPPAP